MSEKEEIKLSVITPVLNKVRFVESCIENVIKQNCLQAEHIIVDGRSADGTIDIIKRFAREYSYVRWVSEEDNGQSDAMNKGIKMARGAIIGVLNADDFYEPGVFSRVLEIFRTLPVPSLLIGNCNVWDDHGRLIRINRPGKITFRSMLSGRGWPTNPSAYFYHKLLHQKVCFYDADCHIGMDINFLLEIVQVAHVTYFDETWGNFRLIKGTKTYENSKSGIIGKIAIGRVKKYTKRLAYPQRVIVSVEWNLRRILNMFRNYLQFCLGEPKEALKKLLLKIQMLFRMGSRRGSV